MNINRGYKHIQVKLLNFDGDSLAKRCYDFGRFGNDGYKPLPERYEPTRPECAAFIDEIIAGKTFPKYALTAIRIDFSVERISRICLAQLTRDPAIFCSESHGLRPMSQDLTIPLNMVDDPKIMGPFTEAQALLEKAYIAACEKQLPYPETRYLMPHAQTISLTCSYTIADFVRACFSRTNNSFCDELNYVYRKMFYMLTEGINNTVMDENSFRLWDWLINEKKCIDDGVYTRTNVFNGDFSMQANGCDKNAQNDWRNSCWKQELERMFYEERELLTVKEVGLIHEWMQMDDRGEELPTTYCSSRPRAAHNAIKDMPYYRGNNEY